MGLAILENVDSPNRKNIHIVSSEQIVNVNIIEFDNSENENVAQHEAHMARVSVSVKDAVGIRLFQVYDAASEDTSSVDAARAKAKEITAFMAGDSNVLNLSTVELDLYYEEPEVPPEPEESDDKPFTGNAQRKRSTTKAKAAEPDAPKPSEETS